MRFLDVLLTLMNEEQLRRNVGRSIVRFESVFVVVGLDGQVPEGDRVVC